MKTFPKSFLQLLLKVFVGMYCMTSVSLDTLQAQALSFTPSCPLTNHTGLNAQKKQNPIKKTQPTPKKAAKPQDNTHEKQLKEVYDLLEHQAKQTKSKSVQASLIELSKITRKIQLTNGSKELNLAHIEKGLNLAKATQAKIDAKSCSDCHSLKSLIKKVLYTLVDTRNRILQEVEELSEHLECLQRIVIDELPCIIAESGSYCLKESISVSGSQPAITVVADNVDIDLGDHVITLDPATSGITAVNITNLRVHNGTIASSSPDGATNAGIFLANVTYCEFTDLIFSNTLAGYVEVDCSGQSITNCTFDHEVNDSDTRGILLQGGEGFTITDCYFGAIGPVATASPAARAIDVNIDENYNISTNVTISGCQFTNSNLSSSYISTSSAIYVLGSSNVAIEDCQMQNSSTSNPTSDPEGTITMAPSCDVIPNNISIRNCDILQAHVSGIAALQYDNLLIEDCRIMAASDNDYNCLQLGNPVNTFPPLNAIIRNCSFSNPDNVSHRDFDNVIVVSAAGLLIEESNFAAAIPVANPPQNNANLLIAQAAHNIKIANCTFTDVCPIDILIGQSSDVTVDSCIMDGAAIGIKLIQATVGTVKNCEIAAAGNFGISLQTDSAYNQIFNNNIRLTQTGSGIILDGSSSNNVAQSNICSDNGTDGITIIGNNNVVKNNTCSNNGNNGINNTGTHNEFYFNTACNNNATYFDCVNVAPAQTPGSNPVLAGSNICCTTAP